MDPKIIGGVKTTIQPLEPQKTQGTITEKISNFVKWIFLSCFGVRSQQSEFTRKVSLETDNPLIKVLHSKIDQLNNELSELNNQKEKLLSENKLLLKKININKNNGIIDVKLNERENEVKAKISNIYDEIKKINDEKEEVKEEVNKTIEDLGKLNNFDKLNKLDELNDKLEASKVMKSKLNNTINSNKEIMKEEKNADRKKFWENSINIKSEQIVKLDEVIKEIEKEKGKIEKEKGALISPVLKYLKKETNEKTKALEKITTEVELYEENKKTLESKIIIKNELDKKYKFFKSNKNKIYGSEQRKRSEQIEEEFKKELEKLNDIIHHLTYYNNQYKNSYEQKRNQQSQLVKEIYILENKIISLREE